MRFSCLWMSLHESKGKGVGLACSPVLLEGRNLSPGGKGFVPSIEASGIPMSLQEKTLLQFLILKSLSINTCCCYPPPAIWSIFPCIPPNYSWMSDTCSEIRHLLLKRVNQPPASCKSWGSNQKSRSSGGTDGVETASGIADVNKQVWRRAQIFLFLNLEWFWNRMQPIMLQHCCHPLFKLVMIAQLKHFDLWETEDQSFVMEPVISGGGEDPISTGAASQVMARGRQASHGQSTLTDALASLACCPSSMPSLLVSANSFCLENTGCWSQCHDCPPVDWLARERLRRRCAHAHWWALSSSTRRGQSCSCGWVTVSHHRSRHRSTQSGNWSRIRRRRWALCKNAPSTAIIHTDQPMDRLVRRMSVPVLWASLPIVHVPLRRTLMPCAHCARTDGDASIKLLEGWPLHTRTAKRRVGHANVYENNFFQPFHVATSPHELTACLQESVI